MGNGLDDSTHLTQQTLFWGLQFLFSIRSKMMHYTRFVCQPMRRLPPLAERKPEECRITIVIFNLQPGY